MVYEDKNNWYADEGALSRQLCELPSQNNEEDATDKECCACDEAKYKASFNIKK